MRKQHEQNSTMSTWQRVGAWFIIACGVFVLLLLVLDVVEGFAHFTTAVKQATSGVGMLALGTGQLLAPRRRSAAFMLFITATLLFIVSFVVPFSPQ
jgi:hypothetical protein